MSCRNPIQIKSPTGNGYIYCPCGKCAWCRKDKRDEWYLRFKVESQHNEFTKFVTLTYTDEQLPFFLDDETGEYGYRADKTHIQKFIKRLRKAGHKFKYFIVSEYAPKTRRPHYHGIFFSDENLTDEVIRKHWDKGVTDTQDADDGALKYVTKYILKGSDRDGNFKLQSTRPAIGSDYVTEFNAKHSYRENEDGIKQHSFVMNGHIKPMPRYYKKKFKQFFDELEYDMNKVKMIEALEKRDKYYYLEKKFWKKLKNYENIDEVKKQKIFEDTINFNYHRDNKEQYNINSNSKEL